MLSLLFIAISLIFAVHTVFANSNNNLFGVTIHNPDQTYDGFTLFTPIRANNGSEISSTVYLVDMRGNVVHSWNVWGYPNLYAYLLPTGNLLYAGKDIFDAQKIMSKNCTIQELDWDGNVVWEYRHPDMHHDFHRMPNGNTLVLVDEVIPHDYNKNMRGGIPGTEANGTDVHSDYIIEVAPNGTTVWEWHAYEHLNPDYYTLDGLDLRNEWTHANSVKYLPAGNPFNGRESILTSFRETDTVLIIDKATGNVSWVWGKGVIKHQHDSTFLPTGDILLFDNGNHRPGLLDYSQVLEVNPKTGNITRLYNDDGSPQFYSTVFGSAQRLLNGNTLICDGVNGRIIEVTPDRKIAWEYISPYGGNNTIWQNAIFRAYRYGPNDINWPVIMPSPDPLKMITPRVQKQSIEK